MKAVKKSDICMVLVPDELQADLYNELFEEKSKRMVHVYCLLMDFPFISNL